MDPQSYPAPVTASVSGVRLPGTAQLPVLTGVLITTGTHPRVSSPIRTGVVFQRKDNAPGARFRWLALAPKGRSRRTPRGKEFWRRAAE